MKTVFILKYGLPKLHFEIVAKTNSFQYCRGNLKILHEKLSISPDRILKENIYSWVQGTKCTYGIHMLR